MATPELNKALSALQKELPTVEKGREGKVEGTSKQGKAFSYTYGYADLADVTDAIMPRLGQHGLAYTAEPGTSSEGRLVLDYSLRHSSGEQIDASFPLWLFLPDRATAQTAGGLITYFRRYCLCAVTGVAPKGEDDDAATASQAKPGRPRQVQRPTAPVTRTRTTGPDHERLRDGTVEPTPQDRPAQRDRGPVPDDQNLWQDIDPELQPGGAQPGDVQKIQMAYQKLGFDHRTDREQLLNISEQIIGRLLEGPKQGRTHNNLSHPEARKLRDTLESFSGDRGLLMEQLTGIRQAAAGVAAQNGAEGSQEPAP